MGSEEVIALNWELAFINWMGSLAKSVNTSVAGVKMPWLGLSLQTWPGSGQDGKGCPHRTVRRLVSCEGAAQTGQRDWIKAHFLWDERKEKFRDGSQVSSSGAWEYQQGHHWDENAENFWNVQTLLLSPRTEAEREMHVIFTKTQAHWRKRLGKRCIIYCWKLDILDKLSQQSEYCLLLCVWCWPAELLLWN